jgi:hypothetical protein
LHRPPGTGLTGIHGEQNGRSAGGEAGMKNKHRICIVEVSTSHDNDAFSQMELLREHFEVHVIAPLQLLNMDLFRATSQLYHAKPLPELGEGNRWMRLACLPLTLWRIRSYCARINADAIIFNTTFTLADLCLITMLFPRGKTFQIIHNYQRFLNPIAFRFFKWFKNNMVLSEEVFDYISRTHKTTGKLAFFLPIFFRSFMDTCPDRQPKWKRGRALFNLGVFGTVDQKRRNYQGLVDAVERIKASGEVINFQIHLVGSAPAEFVKMIQKKGLADIISVYGFCSFADMFALAENMDMVFFLIDSEVPNFQYYNKYKVSGTSVLLKTFRKVGISSDDFPVDRSLQNTVLYYQGTDVGAILKEVARGAITKKQIQEMEKKYAEESLISFETQQQQLIRALGLGSYFQRQGSQDA